MGTRSCGVHPRVNLKKQNMRASRLKEPRHVLATLDFTFLEEPYPREVSCLVVAYLELDRDLFRKSSLFWSSPSRATLIACASANNNSDVNKATSSKEATKVCVSLIHRETKNSRLGGLLLIEITSQISLHDSQLVEQLLHIGLSYYPSNPFIKSLVPLCL